MSDSKKENVDTLCDYTQKILAVQFNMYGKVENNLNLVAGTYRVISYGYLLRLHGQLFKEILN